MGDETAEPDNKQDFSPKKYWEGILPGGLEAHGRIIALGVQVMDALAPLPAVAEATVVVTLARRAARGGARRRRDGVGGPVHGATTRRDSPGQYEEANSLRERGDAAG